MAHPRSTGFKLDAGVCISTWDYSSTFVVGLWPIRGQDDIEPHPSTKTPQIPTWEGTFSCQKNFRGL